MATISEDRQLFVRNYQSGDWEAVYDVCVRTGDRGGDASQSFSEPRIVPDVFAGPYLYLEPDLAFVLDDGERPVGYVIGTADTADFVHRYSHHWLPRLQQSYPAVPTPPFMSNDDFFLFLLHRPERMLVTEVLERHPAHLHIDILPPYQGRGFGRRLIETFTAAAGQAGAPGVHVGVGADNHGAQRFYLKVGFRPIEVQGPSEGVLYYGLTVPPG